MLKAFSFLLFIFSGFSPAFGAISAAEQIQRANQSLVEIQTVYTRNIGSKTVSYERRGAGIILDSKGLIVTNTHTIKKAPHIFIILRNGVRLKAKVAYTSKHYDFAFLKIDPPHPLKPITWGQPSQSKIGQNILTIGSSERNNQHVLAGVITSIIRAPKSRHNEFIATNLDLFQGDSGGPILDIKGHLLGMVMAKEKKQSHSSLAIASDIIKKQYLRYILHKHQNHESKSIQPGQLK